MNPINPPWLVITTGNEQHASNLYSIVVEAEDFDDAIAKALDYWALGGGKGHRPVAITRGSYTESQAVSILFSAMQPVLPSKAWVPGNEYIPATRLES